MHRAKVVKDGDHLVVVVPSELASASDLRVGEQIDVEVRGDTIVVLRTRNADEPATGAPR